MITPFYKEGSIFLFFQKYIWTNLKVLEIASAIQEVIEAGKEISVANVVTVLKSFIVAKYDKSRLYDNKKVWINRIQDTFSLMELQHVC